MRDAFMILLSELKLNNTPCSMGIVVTCPWWLERTRWVHTRTCTSQRNPTQPPLFLSSLRRCSPAASPPTPPPQTWWLICFYVLSHWCYPFFSDCKRFPHYWDSTRHCNDRPDIVAVSGPTEHCSIFHFPSVLRSSVRSSQAWHINFSWYFDYYTMKTIYFLNAYHLGW